MDILKIVPLISVHFQRSFKEKLLTGDVKIIHTPTNLFQNISYRNKIMQIIFIPQHYPPLPPPHPVPTHIFFMTALQDTQTYIQNEVILVLINFACKLRIRFATLFEKHLLDFETYFVVPYN